MVVTSSFGGCLLHSSLLQAEAADVMQLLQAAVVRQDHHFTLRLPAAQQLGTGDVVKLLQALLAAVTFMHTALQQMEGFGPIPIQL
jgi:hypothetical protein